MSQLDLSRRQPLLPLGSDFAVRFYDAAKLDRYKDAVLSVLERTGVRFGSPKALDILAEHGAQVDRASGVVRFAPDLVTAALAKAPRTFWLGSRDGTLDLDLASGETYNTTNGCGTEVVDWHTGVRRQPTKDDLSRDHADDRLPGVGAVLVAQRGRRRHAATRTRSTSWTPPGTTPPSTSRAWCRASARRGTPWRWRPWSRAGRSSCAAAPR